MKITQRNRRVINVLKMRIDELKELVDKTMYKSEKDIYMREVTALRTCISLLIDNEFLNTLEQIYNSFWLWWNIHGMVFNNW